MGFTPVLIKLQVTIIVMLRLILSSKSGISHRTKLHQLISRFTLHTHHQINNVDLDNKPHTDCSKMANVVDLLTFDQLHTIPLPSQIFHERFRPDLMHSDVTRFLASLRKGLATTKTRAEVRGSGRKIHPQKGTGRARAGTSRAPHRRKGKSLFLELFRWTLFWT